MDSEFWGGLVMRLSVTEPIVKHAIISLSSLHEFISANKSDKRLMNPPMIFSEYITAIRALAKQSDVRPHVRMDARASNKGKCQ